MIQAIGRERGTINYSTWEMHNIRDVRKSKESQGLRLRMEGCAVAWVGQKVIVEVTIHDGMLDLRPNGAGNRHLRCDLWEKSRKICC